MKYNDSFNSYSIKKSRIEPNRNGKRNTIMSLCMPKMRHDKVKVVRENVSRGRGVSKSNSDLSSGGPNVETSMMSSDGQGSGPINYWHKSKTYEKRPFLDLKQ